MTEQQQAAMRQALEALEEIHRGNMTPMAEEAWNKAITAMRQALEQQSADEPVGQLQEDAFGRGQVMWFNKPADQSMLYTRPQPAAWVGLTDEEIVLIVGECAASHQHTDIHFARAIEAALRSKNT